MWFGRYAYPPNELGYCGPDGVAGRAIWPPHAREFDGAWPYLPAIADAAGIADPLDQEVVRGYWIGGPLFDAVIPPSCWRACAAPSRARSPVCSTIFRTRSTSLAHHSFHVFVVYPGCGSSIATRDPAAGDAGLPHPVGHRRVGPRARHAELVSSAR